MRSIHLRWLLVALLAWASAIGTVAAQPPRAVVLSFAGRQASRAREAVIQALAPEVQLVSEEQAVASAAQLHVDVSTPEGMAEVIHALDITFVIAGSVEGRGRNAQTLIMVLDASGNELARRSAPTPRRASDLDAIAAAAIEAVREAESVMRRHAEPAPVIEQEAPRAPEPEPEPTPAPVAMAWRPRQLVAYAGVRLRNVGNYVNDVSGELHYFAADAYPEIDLQLDYHPWHEADDELRGVFFSTQGSFSVGMAWVGESGDARGMTSLRWRLDVGYGYVIGDVLEIAGMLGFGIEGVQLDQPDNFPSTLYSYLRPGIGARLRVVPDLLILEAGAGGRIGLDGGPLAAAFGPSVFFGGVDLYLGVAGTIDPGFSWAARIGYIHDALSFSGGGGTGGTGIDGTHEAVEGRFLIGWAI